MVTDGDNPDRYMPQQREGLQCKAHRGLPILQQRSTGRNGGGSARPDQQERGRVNALPQDKYGELQESVDGVRFVVSVRLATVSDVVLTVVVGRGLESNESP